VWVPDDPDDAAWDDRVGVPDQRNHARFDVHVGVDQARCDVRSLEFPFGRPFFERDDFPVIHGDSSVFQRSRVNVNQRSTEEKIDRLTQVFA